MQAVELIRVETSLAWGCFRATGGNWVAVCEPLKLTVQSQTWAELMEDIADTLDALLQDLLSTNELPKFLLDHGWQVANPIPVQAGPIRFDVPFLPAMMGAPA